MDDHVHQGHGHSRLVIRQRHGGRVRGFHKEETRHLCSYADIIWLLQTRMFVTISWLLIMDTTIMSLVSKNKRHGSHVC